MTGGNLSDLKPNLLIDSNLWRNYWVCLFVVWGYTIWEDTKEV